MTRKDNSIARRQSESLVGYDEVLADLVGLLESARRAAVRSVNALMTATYWLVGRRIVEGEQRGKARARYGEALIKRLSEDLGGRFGRGFSMRNLEQMRRFYLAWPIPQTASAESGAAPPGVITQTASADSKPLPAKRAPSVPAPRSRSASVLLTPSVSLPRDLAAIASRVPLPWSHYVRLISVESTQARSFYEFEAIRGGWTVRQLERQIGSKFYERTLLSRNKAAMLRKGSAPRPEDAVCRPGVNATFDALPSRRAGGRRRTEAGCCFAQSSGRDAAPRFPP